MAQLFYCNACRQNKDRTNYSLLKGVPAPRCRDCVFQEYSCGGSKAPRSYMTTIHPHKQSAQFSSLLKYWNSARALIRNGFYNSAVDNLPFHAPLTEAFSTSTPLAVTDKIYQYVFSNFVGGGPIVSGLRFRGDGEDLRLEMSSNKISKLLAFLQREFPFLRVRRGELELDLINNVKKEDLVEYKKIMRLLPLEMWEDKWSLSLWEVGADGNFLRKVREICCI